MAEINIERKKTPVWRWLLILLVLALVAWAVYEFAFDQDADEYEEIPATGMVTLNQSLVLLT